MVCLHGLPPGPVKGKNSKGVAFLKPKALALTEHNIHDGVISTELSRDPLIHLEKVGRSLSAIGWVGCGAGSTHGPTRSARGIDPTVWSLL